MKAIYKRSYRSQKGNTVFVYEVTGTPVEITEYEAITGDQLRVDDVTGKPLMFTTRFFGNTGNLLVIGNDEKGKRVIPDMSEFEAAASLSQQFGGNLGAELARAAAEKLMSSKTSASSSVAADKPVPSNGSNEQIGGM